MCDCNIVYQLVRRLGVGLGKRTGAYEGKCTARAGRGSNCFALANSSAQC